MCRICNSLDETYFGFCQECLKKIPCLFFDKNQMDAYRIIINHCEKHGIYLSNNHTTLCKECLNTSCEMCHNAPQDKTIVCKECLLKIPNPRNIPLDAINLGVIFCEKHKEFYLSIGNRCQKCLDEKLDNIKAHECAICNNGYVYRGKICKSCYELYPADFDKSKIYNLCQVMECKEHGIYLTNHHATTAKCPLCPRQFPKSKVCKDFEELMKTGTVKDDVLMIKILPTNDSDFSSYACKIEKCCQTCGRKYIARSSRSKFCGYCYKILQCKVCKGFYTCEREGSCFCGRSCSKYQAWIDGVYDDMSHVFPDLSKLELNKVENIERFHEIDTNNLIKYKGVSCVWFKYDSLTDEILDVCLTVDLEREMGYKEPQNDKYKYFKELESQGRLKFKILQTISDWNEGLDIEMKFALDNRARFWKPAPGRQVKEFYQIIKAQESEETN